MKIKQKKTVYANVWGIKPLKTKVGFKQMAILGQDDSLKQGLIRQIIKRAYRAGFSVHTFSNSGVVSSLNINQSSRNDFLNNFDNSDYNGALVIYDGTIKGSRLTNLKTIVHEKNALVLYVGDVTEETVPNDKLLKEPTTVNYISKNKIELIRDGATKSIRTLRIAGLSAKQISVAVIALGIGFGLGGMYNLRNVALIGSGDYSVTAQEAKNSGMLYSTPDGVAIGIMNSIDSKVSEKDISKAVSQISNKQNVGVLTLQPSYYKTSQGLNAIVDFGLSAKVDVDKTIKSEKMKETAWKAYTNRKVSYVVVNTEAYESSEKEEAEEKTAKQALVDGDLTTLSDDENVSAVGNVSTTSSQVTQLPLYTDTTSMAKIKNAKTGSVVEIKAGDFKVFFKMESDEKSKKSDKEYKSYLKRLASNQVGKDLASKVSKNKAIDSNSRVAIENDIKTALSQYGIKG